MMSPEILKLKDRPNNLNNSIRMTSDGTKLRLVEHSTLLEDKFLSKCLTKTIAMSEDAAHQLPVSDDQIDIRLLQHRHCLTSNPSDTGAIIIQPLLPSESSSGTMPRLNHHNHSHHHYHHRHKSSSQSWTKSVVSYYHRYFDSHPHHHNYHTNNHCYKHQLPSSASTSDRRLLVSTLMNSKYLLTLLISTTLILNICTFAVDAASVTALADPSSSLSKKSGLRQQKFEMEPIDKTAIIGDTIILPCRVENKVGTLQWTRDGFGLGTIRTLEGFQRYRMVGSDDEGDYSLEISPVALEDDAVFQCQVGAVEGIYGIRSRSATFTVQVPPEPPVIVVTHAHSHAQVYKSTENEPGELTVSASGSESASSSSASVLSSPTSTSNDHHLRTTAGMTIELTCEAHGGRPPAELTWMDSAGNGITNGVSYSTTKLSDGKRWNAALKWTVVASRALDGQRVTCRSENAALKSPRYAHIQLEVRYPPEVELRIASAPENGIVRAGDDLTLECIAAGNPSRMTFKWSRDGAPIGSEADVGANGDGTPRLVLRRVGREYHGTVFACEVANSVGTSRAKLEVKIAFKPRFVKPPEPVIGISKGESIRLECHIDSYPKPTFYWSKYLPKLNLDPNAANRYTDHWQEMGEGPFIEVETAGRYRCIAKSSAFDDELKSETFVFVKGAPLIRSPSIQYAIENEAVRLQCMVEAIPPPTKITWFKLKPYQQILGVDNNEGYEILEEEDPEDFSIPALSSAASSSMSYLTSPAISSSSSSLSPSSFEDGTAINGATAENWPQSSLALLRSIIYIRRAKESDFGQYNCSVWNEYGFQSQIITLQRQANILSPLVLTLSGIVGTGVAFVLIASLIVFVCIRSQRQESLAPNKLDSSDEGSRSGTVHNAMCNGGPGMDGPGSDDMEKKINTLNSMEKNLMLKNTIMKMNGSNQILTTVVNGNERISSYVPNGTLPVYTEYEYNYSYPTNDMMITNGGVINNGQLPAYGYDTISNYNGHYIPNDYSIQDNHQIGMSLEDKNKPGLHITNYHSADTNNLNNTHLYSTVVKNHPPTSQSVDQIPNGKPSNGISLSSTSSNYTTLLSTSTTAAPLPPSVGMLSDKMINTSNSHPSISSSGVCGLPQPPLSNTYPTSNTLTYSGTIRAKDSFANPYMRTSTNNTNGLPMNHYSNLDSSETRLLSAGVYNANQHNRYKTNSVGGGSSSSGVVSTGGSSPGHSPVGSMSGQTGTHV